MMDGSALPQPGDTIAGKYVLERVIGEGGMSVVYGATHRVTGKRFAIKWMLPDQTPTSGETARRFIREAQVAGLFQHPNVVEVYDVGQVSGSFYMVMEWLDGESLASRLERAGAISFTELCAYLIPCMHGVMEAHAAGIVHRDLKPANIFLCRAMHHTPERPKVLDFGIAKLSKHVFDVNSLVTKSGVLIGTPHYLSPEQLRSLPVDYRTDIYALGVIMYQLLSGTLPFPADNFGQLVLQIATGTPVPLRDLLPGLPRGVPEIVAKAMALEPDERFQDLRELVAVLEEVAAGGLPLLAAAPDASQERKRSTPAGGLEYPANASPAEAPGFRAKSGELPLTAAEAGAELLEPGSGSGAKRRVWTYAVVAAVFVIGCLVLAKLWFLQPEAASAERPALAQPAAAAPETTASAATSAADVTATDRAPAPNLERSARDLPAAPVAPAPGNATPAAAPVARSKRASRPAPPGGPQPTAAPAPPQSAPGTPDPIDHNPLHMKLQ